LSYSLSSGPVSYRFKVILSFLFASFSQPSEGAESWGSNPPTLSPLTIPKCYLSFFSPLQFFNVSLLPRCCGIGEFLFSSKIFSPPPPLSFFMPMEPPPCETFLLNRVVIPPHIPLADNSSSYSSSPLLSPPRVFLSFSSVLCVFDHLWRVNGSIQNSPLLRRPDKRPAHFFRRFHVSLAFGICHDSGATFWNIVIVPLPFQICVNKMGLFLECSLDVRRFIVPLLSRVPPPSACAEG